MVLKKNENKTMRVIVRDASKNVHHSRKLPLSYNHLFPPNYSAKII